MACHVDLYGNGRLQIMVKRVSEHSVDSVHHTLIQTQSHIKRYILERRSQLWRMSRPLMKWTVIVNISAAALAEGLNIVITTSNTAI